VYGRLSGLKILGLVVFSLASVLPQKSGRCRELAIGTMEGGKLISQRFHLHTRSSLPLSEFSDLICVSVS